MIVGTVPLGGLPVDNAKSKLQELWKAIFERRQSASTIESGTVPRTSGVTNDINISPLTLEVMLHSTEPLRYGRGGQNDGEPELLLMVGYSEEQLALSIAAHVRAGCRKIVPFSTLAAWTSVQSEVVACLYDLGLSLSGDYQFDALQPIEPNDPANVFRKVLNWVREHPDRRPAIECTGGKKPMDFGSAYAASFYGLPAYYVDFDGYNPQLRRPWPWTCRYHCLSLPDTAVLLRLPLATGCSRSLRQGALPRCRRYSSRLLTLHKRDNIWMRRMCRILLAPNNSYSVAIAGCNCATTIHRFRTTSWSLISGLPGGPPTKG